MLASLMGARRFAPLFWCQFLSAFNDNFVRQMLAMTILFRLGEAQSGPLITLAVGIFILPSLLISALGGEIADSHDKAIIARRLKFAEIFVQMVAAAGFFFGALLLLYAALFGLGIISALFGPIKYGILPDHLARRELPAGNALIEGATFLAILLGLVVGGYAADHARAPAGVVAQLLTVAIACWATSRFIPKTGVAAPSLKVNPNILASTWRMLAETKRDRRIWIGAIAVSVFWMTGAIALSLVPLIVKTRIGGGIDVETAISALFAIGIALGSLLAAALAHGRIMLLPTPVAGLLMAAFLVDLGVSTYHLPAAGATIALTDFFRSATGVRLALDVAALAGAGGLFVVPVFSAVQAWAGEDRRARVVAGVNILTALFMVGGTLLVALLQVAGASGPALLIALGLANLGLAAWLFRALPGNFIADFGYLLFRFVYRVEVVGLDNIKTAGERCVIAFNHTSFIDAAVALSVLEEKPVFAIDSQVAKAWWAKPFLNVARCVPIDPSKALSTRALIKEVRAGNHLVIFPEGRITVTGSLMKIYDGAAMIAEKSDATIVPARLEGLQRTPFSRLTKALTRKALFPKVRVTFLAPRKLALDPDLLGRKRRVAAGEALQDIMTDLVFETTPIDMTLTQALTQSARRFGAAKIVLEDPLAGKMSMRALRAAAAVLARKIAVFTAPGECVGLLLPNANGVAATFFGVQAAGRVPVMLNFSAGADAVISACATARIKTVLTSRAFVERGRLGDLVEQLGRNVAIRYLEDVRAGVTAWDRVRGLVESGREYAPRKPDDPAAILFTSGSEGTPKGVVLSHRNLLANVAQVVAAYDITPRDIMFNPLPVFHSFGLTGGLVLPLMSGMRTYLYPSPLHYRYIPELVYGTNATVLFGTDTFLAGYARAANAYDFRSVRYIVAGAERVRDETRKTYMDKFGLRIMEGYGVTETSPVLAVNTPMFNRPGTVGRLMPRVEHRLEPVPGIEDAGRLIVRGPNVMLGYYRAEQPGVLQPPPEGWYDTGDICAIDRQSFVTIKGRAKRFAKIAGEMVSLAAVEQMLADLLADHGGAVVAAPDARKGERIVLATTKQGLTRGEAQAHVRQRGGADLMAPSEVLVFDKLPLLGSGKTDYVALDRLVREKLGDKVGA